MVLGGIFFLIGGLLPAGDEAPPAPTPAELLRSARHALERESAPEPRKEALRVVAQVAVLESARSASSARRLLHKSLDDRDPGVAAEAIRLLLLAEEPRDAARALAPRLVQTVRDLRRIMAEVERHRRVRSPSFLESFRRWSEPRQLAGLPGYVEALCSALASLPGDRATDALEDLLDLDPRANSGRLILAATEALLHRDDPEALEVVVDWIRVYRAQFGPPKPGARSSRTREPSLGATSRFGRLRGLEDFRAAHPPVDSATYQAVQQRVRDWAKQRQLPPPPGAGGDWRAWHRSLR